MPLVLPLHLVMMSECSKFVVGTFNTFWEMGYIKGFAQQWWQFSDHNCSTFSSKLASDKLKTCLHVVYTFGYSSLTEIPVYAVGIFWIFIKTCFY